MNPPSDSTTHPKPRSEILDIARDLAAQFSIRAAEHDHDGSFPHENFAAIRASGYPALAVPVALGGWGGTLTDAVMAQEILGAGDGSTALAITMHTQTVGAAASGERWDASLFGKLAQEIVTRGALVNACATEPELGSPSRGGKPHTAAQRTESAFIINGTKSYASMSPTLDYFIIPAVIVGETDSSGRELIGRFLVPRQDQITIQESWNGLGMRSTGSHDITLTDAHAPLDHLIAASPVNPPDLDRIWVNIWFTLTVSAVYLGVASAAIAAAIKYAHERIPTALGKPIAELESVQHRIGEADLELAFARNALYHMAQRYDDLAATPDQRTALMPEVAGTKVAVMNAAIRIVDHSMRAVGGAAMTHDLPLERYYRDVRAGLYHPPAEDQLIPQLGRQRLHR